MAASLCFQFSLEASIPALRGIWVFVTISSTHTDKQHSEIPLTILLRGPESCGLAKIPKLHGARHRVSSLRNILCLYAMFLPEERSLRTQTQQRPCRLRSATSTLYLHSRPEL